MAETPEELISEEMKNKLLELLDLRVKSSNFYDEILKKIDSINTDENMNIETLYNEIYEFMTNNMPEDVQSAFFDDVRKLVSLEKERKHKKSG